MKVSFSLGSLDHLFLNRKGTFSCSVPIAKPTRDWTILVCGSTLFFLACVGVAVESYLLAQAQGEGGSPEMVSEQAPQFFDRTALTELLVQYDSRRDAHQRLLVSPSLIADPARGLLVVRQ